MVINTSQYLLKLHANCVAVKGYSRSAVYDLQFSQIHLIPNGLYDILAKYDNVLSVPNIYAEYDNDSVSIIEGYVKYLLDNKLAFICNDTAPFVPINFEYYTSTRITNAVIDYMSNSNMTQLLNAINQLNNLGCEAIRLRFLDLVDHHRVREILDMFNNSSIMHIEIIFAYKPQFDLTDIIGQYLRIKQVIAFGMDKTITETLEDVPVIYKDGLFQNTCKVGDLSSLHINMRFFMDACNHNTCSYGKITIDSNGCLRTCPYSKDILGNICDTSIIDAISNNKHPNYDTITKDMVEVCKDCEFRYACVDCRTFVKHNLYSMPQHCVYNPYIAKWSNENGYVDVDVCGIYSADGIFHVDMDMINELNAESK